MDLSLDLDPTSLSYLDLLFIDGDVPLTSDGDTRGANPVLQNVGQNLRTYQGEWFLDTTLGLPWFQTILQKGTTQSQIDSIIQGAILATRGIVQLSSYSSTLNPAARTLAVQFTASTTSGPINYSDTIQYAAATAG